MKQFSLVTMVWGCTGLVLGCNYGQDQAASGVKPKVNCVTISEEVLSWNGKKLDLPATRKDTINLLGEPTRETKLANTILTWDKLGVYVYVHAKTGRVRSLHIGLRKETFDFTPKVPFNGTLILDGVKITAESSIAGINALRKSKPFKMVFAGTSDWWKIEHVNTKVYIQTASDDGKGITFLAIETKPPQ